MCPSWVPTPQYPLQPAMLGGDTEDLTEQSGNIHFLSRELGRGGMAYFIEASDLWSL